jgi:hypothetical protein
MGWGRISGGRRGSNASLGLVAPAVALLALLTLMTALVPASASALDSDFKHTYAFRVGASNGYSLFAIADSQRLDGKGELVLFVGSKRAQVTYLAPATVTATRIEADLGRLGQVSLDVAPSGKKRQLHACGTPKTVRFEPPTYRGSFEFHGEEGYTEAISSSPRDFSRVFSRLSCGLSVGGGETSGRLLPGARLKLRFRSGPVLINLQANKNRADARTKLVLEAAEVRQGIEISRTVAFWTGTGAFGYDLMLRTASLAPPVPFSGHATYNRSAAPRARWSGDLSVDLPGRSNLALTGAGIHATLAHACFQEDEADLDCQPPGPGR